MARILIVEDESVAAWYLQEALENMGHQIIGSVAAAEAAIQFAGETQPTLILMDIRLQGEMDGIAAAEQIHAQFDIPVVYLTAHADDSTLSRAIATNPFGYLVKPFQEREVHTTIEIALRRHDLEKRTKYTQSWLANTLNSVGDAMIATDQNGTVTFINPEAETLTGWSSREAMGRDVTTILTFLQEETCQEIENPLMQAMREGTSLRLPDSCLLRTKWGSERPISDAAAPIKNDQGEIIGSVMVFQDVSSQRQALTEIRERNLMLELNQINLLARLKERTTQLQQVLACTRILKRVMAQVQEDSTQIQILQTTVSELGRILEADYCWVALYNANHTLSTIHGEYIASGEINTDPSALGAQIDMQSLDEFYQPLRRGKYWLSPSWDILPAPYKGLLTSESQILSCPLIDKNVVIGDVTILRTGKPPWHGLHGELISQVISQCAAIQQQAHACEVTQNYVADLEVLTQIKDEFIRSVSQELSNPLTNMKMAVEMLSSLLEYLQSADNPTEPSPKRKSLWQKMEHYLQILREECQREFDLVSDLLNFQSLGSLTNSIPLSPIDIKEWLPSIVNQFSEKAVRQRQILSCDVASELTTLVSHKPSLTRIVSELLTNACKYSPPDSWIAVDAQVQGTQVAIKVTNTGVTIPPEEFSLIFQPFYRIARPDLWNYGGTGVGLALVKKLVQLLGGEIRVHSKAGATTFTVTLFPSQHQPLCRRENEESGETKREGDAI